MKYKCIDPGEHSRLSKGAIYDGRTYQEDDGWLRWTEITFDDGVQIAYAPGRFEEVKEP